VEQKAMPNQDDFFGEVISSYTRAEAIKDGVLVDLSDSSCNFRPGLNILQEAGIKFPVAMTRAAFESTVQKQGEPLPPAQDVSGRLWDVLTMLKYTIRTSAGGDLLFFPVRVWNWVYRDGQRTERTKHADVRLKAVCGPGDNAEPVITIMLPDED
jgi:hypothetical protein